MLLVHHNSRTPTMVNHSFMKICLRPLKEEILLRTSLLKQPNAKVNRCHFQCVKNGLLPSQFFPPFLSIDLLLSELWAEDCCQFRGGGGAVLPAAPLGRPLLGLGDSWCIYISFTKQISMTTFLGLYSYKIMSIIRSKLKLNQLE